MGTGKVGNVVITGGASGLGAATVDAVIRRGGTALVLDRNTPSADVPYQCVDLADTEAVETAVTALAEQVGGVIDGVFTAGGTDACGKLADLPVKDWERVIHVNLLGTVAVVRAALPYLKASGDGSSRAPRRWASKRSATPPRTAPRSSVSWVSVVRWPPNSPVRWVSRR